VVYERFVLCSMGCSLRVAGSCAVEARVGVVVIGVGIAVLEGGLGGMLDVAEQLDVRAAAPKLFTVLSVLPSCRVGDEDASI
jgi:hypothetical protein